jgi:hypothetical protein
VAEVQTRSAVGIEPLARDAINLLGFIVMLIVTQFVVHVEQNQNAARHAHGEAENVDQRIAFVLQQIAQRDFEVIFEHGFSPKFNGPKSNVIQHFFGEVLKSGTKSHYSFV